MSLFTELNRRNVTRVAIAYGAFEVWRELGPPPGCQVSGDTFTCQVQ
ncbi:MAG: hypothetical protein WBN41_01245 [Lysobacterales bacterium]